MSAAVVSVWSPQPGLLSEGARWHEQRQQLLWVDILGHRLHRTSPTRDGHAGQIQTVELDRDVGVVAPPPGSFCSSMRPAASQSWHR